MSNNAKKAKAALAVAIGAGAAAMVLGTASGCTSVSTEPDQVALHYEGGSFSSKKYNSFVGPSNKDWFGPGDKTYVYPLGQRSYDATGADGSEHPPFTSSSKDSVELATPMSVTFQLKTDEKTLRTFHEQIGIKYKAYADDGSGDVSGGVDQHAELLHGPVVGHHRGQGSRRIRLAAVVQRSGDPGEDPGGSAEGAAGAGQREDERLRHWRLLRELRGAGAAAGADQRGAEEQHRGGAEPGGAGGGGEGEGRRGPGYGERADRGAKGGGDQEGRRDRRVRVGGRVQQGAGHREGHQPVPAHVHRERYGTEQVALLISKTCGTCPSGEHRADHGPARRKNLLATLGTCRTPKGWRDSWRRDTMTFMSPLLGRRKETLNRIAAALQTTAANDDPWIAPAEIADQLSLSLSYTRSLLKELESEGLARRQRDDDDRQIIIWTWNGPSHA